MNKIALTKSQTIVFNKILSFIESKDRVFVLKGYAGTGKTTLMRFLIDKLIKQKKQFKLLASTGRAAKVLSDITKQATDATTIHSMIYSFSGLNQDLSKVDTTKEEPIGPLFIMFEPTKLDPNISPETIYIIDEASMVSDIEEKDITQAKFGSGRLLKELLDYDTRQRSKYIFVGDPCQLPPIRETFSPALMPEYFQKTFRINAIEGQLTEIMRQSGDNGIIAASKQIRQLYARAPEKQEFYGQQKVWGFLPFRSRQNIKLHPNIDAMLDHYVGRIKRFGYNDAICICRSNKSCYNLSVEVRRRLGLTAGSIQKNDLLMVIQNNTLHGLMNGDQVIVKEVKNAVEVRANMTFRMVIVEELVSHESHQLLLLEDTLHQKRLNLDAEQQKSLFVDFIVRMKKKGIKQKDEKEFADAMRLDPYLNALRCVYGYAVTCHKAQGGEWNNVYIDVPRNITLNPTKETYQWIYTAMTRTKGNMHIVDDFYLR